MWLLKAIKFVMFFLGVLLLTPLILYMVSTTKIADQKDLLERQVFYQLQPRDKQEITIDFNRPEIPQDIQAQVPSMYESYIDHKYMLKAAPFTLRGEHGFKYEENLYYLFPFGYGFNLLNPAFDDTKLPPGLDFSPTPGNEEAYRIWSQIKYNKNDDFYHPSYSDPFVNMGLTKISKGKDWDWGSGVDYLRGKSAPFWRTYVETAQMVSIMRTQVARKKTGLPYYNFDAKDLRYNMIDAYPMRRDTPSYRFVENDRRLLNPAYEYLALDHIEGKDKADRWLVNYNKSLRSGMPRIWMYNFWVHKYMNKGVAQSSPVEIIGTSSKNGPFVVGFATKELKDSTVHDNKTYRELFSEQSTSDFLIRSNPSMRYLQRDSVEDCQKLLTVNFWREKLGQEGISWDIETEQMVNSVIEMVTACMSRDEKRSKEWYPKTIEYGI